MHVRQLLKTRSFKMGTKIPQDWQFLASNSQPFHYELADHKQFIGKESSSSIAICSFQRTAHTPPPNRMQHFEYICTYARVYGTNLLVIHFHHVEARGNVDCFEVIKSVIQTYPDKVVTDLDVRRLYMKREIKENTISLPPILFLKSTLPFY